jgi:hypothetical protein
MLEIPDKQVSCVCDQQIFYWDAGCVKKRIEKLDLVATLKFGGGVEHLL